MDDSKRNIRKHHEDLLTDRRVILVKGDGRKGYEKEAPYNAIHVGAAAPEIPSPVTFIYSVLVHLFWTELQVLTSFRTSCFFVATSENVSSFEKHTHSLKSLSKS